MRSLIALISLLILVGCATQPDLPPYAYKPPIVVSLASQYHTSDYSVAIFTFANVSSDPMTYGGNDREHPVFSIEYESMRGEIQDNNDALVPSFQLSPCQSGTFRVVTKESSGPFRAGISMSGEFDPKIVPSQTYWSPFVTP